MRTTSCVISLFVLLVGYTRGGRVFFRPSEIDEDKGAWTGWYDTDNPSGRGDLETVEDIYHRYMGRGCSHRVPCADPIAMEVDVSWHHKQRYPESNIDDVLACSSLGDPNPNVGFECLNADQENGTPSGLCLNLCEKNGLGANCQECADYEVRYFCLYDDYNCDRKKTSSSKKAKNLLAKLLQLAKN